MAAEDHLAAHVLGTAFATLPREAVESAKTFILDALGVGIAGSRHPRVPQVKRALCMAQPADGGALAASVWGTGERLPWDAAVMANAYQVFNQEYDCIHDQAIVHAMACLLPACLGYAQAHGGVTGRALIAAVTLGLDVAIFVGLAQRAPMRYFRPAMCGGLGATAALCRLGGFDAERFGNAMGLAFSQLSGTMQAHVEGSPAVSLLVGFNARAAVTAFELARAGFPGPRQYLQGQFGYFNLYDFGEADWEAGAAEIGRTFQITRMSHKPYPTGRATHGGIEGVIRLQRRYGFAADDVMEVRVFASALVVRLVGRRHTPTMEPGHARLCMAYCVAAALLTGDVNLEDFDERCLRDDRRLALAARVSLVDNGNPDPNAIGGPQAVEVLLLNGESLRIDLAQILGHPSHPLDLELQDQKFRKCCLRAHRPLASSAIEGLLRSVRAMERLDDVTELLPLTTATVSDSG
jgi:aconitate decarboxylase